MDAARWQDQPDARTAQRRAVPVLFAAQVFGSLGVGVGAPLGSLIAYEVTQREALAGLTRIVMALSTALFAGPLVALAVARGRRASLTLGWTCALLGALLLATSSQLASLPVLLAGMLVFGAGQAANLQSRFAAVDCAPSEHRARTLSLIVWAITIGIVAGPNLTGLGGRLGRRVGLTPIAGGYLLGTVGMAVAALVLVIGLRPDPLRLAQQYEGRPALGRRRGRLADGVATAWRHRRARFALVALVANMIIMASLMTLTPVHMAMHHHGLGVIGLVISLHTLGMFGLSPLVGMLTDRVGAVPTIMVGMAINLASLVTGMLAGASLSLMMLALFLLGLGWSFGHVAGSTLVSDAAPEGSRPRVQAAADTLTSLGSAAGAGIAGPVLMAWGFGGLCAFAMLFLLPVLLLVRGALRASHRQPDEVR